MRITVNLDDKLLEQVASLTGGEEQEQGGGQGIVRVSPLEEPGGDDRLAGHIELAENWREPED